MFWIVFRIPLDNITTRYETDSYADARFTLQGVVINADSQLIDFSPELDGVLDYELDGVRLFDGVTV